MAFCVKCGAEVNDDAKVCPKCGEAIGAAQAQAQSQTDYAAKIASLNDTADSTAEFDAADIEQNKIMGVLAYLSWLVLIPLLAAPKSKFARFHSNQGLILAIAELIFSIAYGIVRAIAFMISPLLGVIVGIVGIVSIVFLVLAILGIINVVNGKAKELPIIGKYRIIK